MNKYNVKSGKGTLIPDWIVEKMLDEQVKQGNPRNVKVFEVLSSTDRSMGGFLWMETVLGHKYWNDIITNGIYPPKPSTDVDELVEKVSNVIRDTLTNSFVLPEKWLVAYRSEREFNIINRFFDKNWGIIREFGGNHGYFSGTFGNNWMTDKNNLLKDDYKELTFEEFEKYVANASKKDEFTLPKKWCIKGTTHDECMAINAYARSLQGGDHWGDEKNNAKYFYLCIKDGKYYKGDYHIDGTLITFEQFQKYVLGVEFILPKLWGVKLTEQSIDTVTGWRRTTTKPSGFEMRGSKYYGSYILNKEPNSKFTAYWVNSLPEGYTEITYEQFLQYVLKSSSPNFVKQHLVEKSPKYKVGDWVSFTSEVDKCIYTSKIKDWTSHSYCVLENKQEPFKHLLRKATLEEIKDAEKDALLAEAKSKYPIGTVFKSAYSGNIREVTDEITIDSYSGGLVSRGAFILYKDEWAEIITTPNITINGYKAEFFPTYVKFGYAEINKEVFIELAIINEYGNTNREVESVTIGRGVFTKAQIKEIADYYNNL